MSATEPHHLPHWEKQADGKTSDALENLRVWLVATGCREGAGNVVCLYKLCSWASATLHHDVEGKPDDPYGLLHHISNTEVFKDLESFLQINTSHFKVFWGA